MEFLFILVLLVIAVIWEEAPWILIIAAIAFIALVVYCIKNPRKGGGTSSGGVTYNTGHIPYSATGKIYSKDAIGFFDGSFNSGKIVGRFGDGRIYRELTGSWIGCYENGKVYTGTAPISDNLIAYISDGKIYSKNGNGFFEGTYKADCIVGYYDDGKIYSSDGKGFFEGSYNSDKIIGYYEGDPEAAAAAAYLLLID